MQEGSPQWLDAEYNNRARVPEALRHLQRWASESDAARVELASREQAALDVRYMNDPGLKPAAQMLDVFTPPASIPQPDGGWPVLMFIHGGYWRALDKADHSFIAPPWVDGQAGVRAVVVIPNYALCPEVSVSTITRQMQLAVGWVLQHVAEYGGNPGRLTVAGHSAGGHLVAMLLSSTWQAMGMSTPPLQHGISISGLFDLEPIRKTPFLADLCLTPEEAYAQSPVNRPHMGGELTAVVGGGESNEFLRQNALLQPVWGERAVPVVEMLPGLDHFTVVDEMVRSGSWLSARIAKCLTGGVR